MILTDQSNLKLLGYPFIFLDDKKKYNKIVKLQSNMGIPCKDCRILWINTYSSDLDKKVFPITKEDNQMKNISKDFKTYEQTLLESDYYLKELKKI